MLKHWQTAAGLLAVLATATCLQAGETATVKGKVVDESGAPMRGVMVSVLDGDLDKSVTVLTDADGQFVLDRLEPKMYDMRARLLGFEDTFIDAVELDAGEKNEALTFSMERTDDINMQRHGASLFGELEFDSEEERMSFKMSCTYCHQIGTAGFRAPEEPVDWQVLITKMDGYGALVPSLKKDNKIVKKLVETYTDNALDKWPAYTPPEPPAGKTLALRVAEWDMGRKDVCMIHDLEPGLDGLIYVVDMANDGLQTLNPETGERITYSIPGGKDPESKDFMRMGPHSIEPDAEGNMWVTMAIGGKMGKFDVKTKEWTIVSSAPDPAPRGAYPHSLRVDKQGVVWYTDAGRGVFSLDPNDENKRVFYPLPNKDQAIGRGVGESRGRTPYGIDIAPNGDVWYTKLNGHRVGRIKPGTGEVVKGVAKGADIVEWAPPFVGPRRLHVAPDGMVWVPGCGSGVFAKFDPESQEWTVYDLPNKDTQFPYALNVHPQTGDVWICGTCNDSMYRFIPSTEELIEYPMPSRVTYTREVEFTPDGSIWVCNSNWPNRHTERRRGSIIKITLDGTVDEEQVATTTTTPNKQVIPASGD